jgi:hypothetical protein
MSLKHLRRELKILRPELKIWDTWAKNLRHMSLQIWDEELKIMIEQILYVFFKFKNHDFSISKTWFLQFPKQANLANLC